MSIHQKNNITQLLFGQSNITVQRYRGKSIRVKLAFQRVSRDRFCRFNRIALHIDRSCSANYVLSQERNTKREQKRKGNAIVIDQARGSFVSRDYENRNYTVNNVPVGALFRLRYEYLLAIIQHKGRINASRLVKGSKLCNIFDRSPCTAGRALSDKASSTQNVR